jgi:hypothetical protein
MTRAVGPTQLELWDQPNLTRAAGPTQLPHPSRALGLLAHQGQLARVKRYSQLPISSMSLSHGSAAVVALAWCRVVLRRSCRGMCYCRPRYLRPSQRIENRGLSAWAGDDVSSVWRYLRLREQEEVHGRRDARLLPVGFGSGLLLTQTSVACCRCEK